MSASAVHDPGLAVPELPGPVPELELALVELARAGQAREGSILLEGERGSALLRERGGLEGLWIDGRRVATDLEAGEGVVVNRVVSPGAVRRERVEGGASVQEVWLLPPRLPLLALQLPRGGEGRRASVTLLPGATRVRWNAEGGRLVAVDGQGDPVVVALSPGGGTVVGRPAQGGGVRVEAELPTGAPATLLVASGGSGLATAPHLQGHARMAGALPRDGLLLATGVEELDAGVAWARARLSSAARRPDAAATPPWAAFWTGVGALAVGDEAAARSLLAALETPRPEEADSDPSHPLALPPEPLALLLAARLALALGDAGPALRLAARSDPIVLEAAEGGRRRLWSVAATALADGIRWSAGEEEAQRWRSLGARLAEPRAREARGGGVRLPMVGDDPAAAGPAPSRAVAAVARLLGEGGAVPGGAPGALAAWTALRYATPEEGWALWREGLGKGLAEGPSGPGSWDGWRPGPAAPETGIVLAALAHGLLGWRPDAPVGRAVLAPRLPPHLRRFTARGLRVGDAEITLEYVRDGAVDRWRLEPTAGRAPVTVAFEPRTPGEVGEVRVDGEPAELDLRREEGGTQVPVQLAVDAVRTLEVERAG